MRYFQTTLILSLSILVPIGCALDGEGQDAPNSEVVVVFESATETTNNGRETLTESGGERVEPFPALTPCETYCQLASDNCTDNNEINFDGFHCEDVCAVFDEGNAGDTSGNTVQCRIYHLTVAGDDPDHHCVHGNFEGGSDAHGFPCTDTDMEPDPDTDSINDNQPVADNQSADNTEVEVELEIEFEPAPVCETYCNLSARYCKGANAIDFGEQTCRRACELWDVGDEADLSGDTVQCRINHLFQAELYPDRFCPIGNLDGGDEEVGFACTD
jgi:hypothetical protein